jgi:hypothetical protein
MTTDFDPSFFKNPSATSRSNPSLVSSCNGAVQHSLAEAGDSLVVTCENAKVTLNVLAGQVGNTLFANDGTTAQVDLAAGYSLTFDPDLGLLFASASNPAPIVLNVEGIQKTVVPGGIATVVALRKFVVLAEDGILLDQRSSVISGSVGTNQASGGPYLAGSEETTIGNNVQFLSPDSWLLGDSVNIANNATVYDVFTNHDILGGGNVLGEVYNNVSLPLGPAFPSVPAFTPGTQDLTVNNNGSLTLDAGSYGQLEAGKNVTVTLTGGVYDFSEWNIDNNAHILVQAPVEIHIAGRLYFGMNSILSPDPASGLTAKDIRIFVTGQNGDDGSLGATPPAAEFGNYAILAASVFVPNGTLVVDNNVTATGAFLGKWVTASKNTIFTLDSGW